MQKQASLLFERQPGVEGDVGVITLNRQQALNALNHEMILGLTDILKEWRQLSQIKAVVVRASEGRAFCAGGDIREITSAAKPGEAVCTRFFYDEYRLNHLIHHYPKPYVALLDGITMGGGVGISLHGSHRVATERLVFAMPETGIGFFPDVGASYFLNQGSLAIGLYLGLTGARLGVSDAYSLGLVSEVVAANALPDVLAQLVQTPLGADPKKAVTEYLAAFHQMPGPAPIEKQADLIDSCFSQKNVEAILDALLQDGSPEALAIFETCLKKSPTSLKVTFAQLHRARTLSFDACMQMEFRLVSHFLQQADFFEGVRAAVIDKDNQPQWSPATLAEVSDEAVSSYFNPVTPELAFEEEAVK